MLGSEEFRKELLERTSAGASHYGAELRESEEEKAIRIIAQEIQKLKFPTRLRAYLPNTISQLTAAPEFAKGPAQP